MNMLLVFLVFLTTTSVLVVPSLGEQFCKRRVCYFSSKAQWRPTPESRFFPDYTDVSLCSHIIYGFAYITANGLQAGEANDESAPGIIGNYEKVTELRLKNRHLKVLLSVRVKPVEYPEFITITSSESSLNEFSGNVIEFLRSHHFDGLDFHFVILGRQLTHPDIKNKISKLLEHLRRAFDEEEDDSDRLLLTAAVYGEKVLERESYNVHAVSKAVDWINFLALDLHGPWYETTTGHHAPLFPDITDTESWDTLYNVHKAVEHWIRGGAHKDKIVLGIPFYGRLFRLTSSETGVGAPATGGLRANYSGGHDFITYFEICELRNLEKYTAVHLQGQGVTYIVSGNAWISYDDIHIVRQKVRYIKEHDLGGFVALSVDDDDVLGYFCDSGPYPLLRAANLECTL